MHTASAVFDPLNSQQLLQVLLKGECEGEPVNGQIAVASVVRNRAEAFPRLGNGSHYDVLNIRSVILAWAQFSCMWESLGGADFQRLVDFVPRVLSAGPFSRVERQLGWIATGVLSDDLVDPTRGATHYYAKSIPAPAWAAAPAVLTAEIGNHRFFSHVA